MVAKRLDGLTARHGACHLAAYADLSARMVLVTNSSATTPREVLNALCAQAADTLAAAPLPDPEGCDVAVVTGGDQVRVFLRLPSEPSEALCCLCAPDIDLAAFVPEARTCLAEMVEPDDAPAAETAP